MAVRLTQSEKRASELRKRLIDERAWMEKCGSDLPGYVQNYHVKHGRSVENATAIYEADKAKVLQLEAQVQAASRA